MVQTRTSLLAFKAAPVAFGLALLSPLNAFAQVHVEVGDAGDLPGSAQVITSLPLLSQISGTLSPTDDQDMFRFHTAGGAFTATVTAAGGDSQLFLFNAAGLGVFANDDATVLGGAASISGILSEGDYFLAISEFNSDPVSIDGLIFPSAIFSVDGPTGLGGDSPISGWTGSGGSGFTYEITLSNASGVPDGVTGVPDAGSTFTLFGIALASLWLAKRRPQ